MKRQSRKRGGEKAVSNEELQKCDTFCSTYYLDKKKKWITNQYKKNYTSKQVDKLIKNWDKTQIIRDCKNVFCNPKCPNRRKHLRTRYSCPICKLDKINKLGAITYCRYDNDVLTS